MARTNALASAAAAFADARLNLDAVLQTVVERVTEIVGDMCGIRLLSDDGNWIRQMAMHHTNPQALAYMQSAGFSAPRRVEDGTLGEVMRTGRSLLLAGLSTSEMCARVQPNYIPYVQRFGMHSVLVVPLRAQGVCIGTLGAWRDTPSPPYTQDDQTFLEQLADRAAQAIDNARLYAEAQNAIRARDEFLSVASHELKTPVTSIRGYAQIMLRNFPEGIVPGDRELVRLRAGLTAIDDQTRRLARFMEQLLDTSRISSGHMILETQRCDLVELITRCTRRAQTQASRRPHGAL
jgi:signal transduction histidine kinase